MKNEFLCPSCKGHLNITDKVVFTIKKKDGKRGLIFLHPELGNYTHSKHETLTFEEGEEVEIFCPLCHKNLIETHDNQKFVRVLMTENNKSCNVLFSSVFNENWSYKICADAVISFGDTSKHKEINFENLSFLK